MPDVTLPPSPFDGLLGTEWISSDPDHAVARLAMKDEHRQPMGIMHGGVMATLVESLCSMATATAVVPENKVAMGQAISVNLLRPVSSGGIEVEATAIHRGRMSWVWRATIKDFEGRTCAIAQMTMAVRDAPDGVDLGFLVKDDKEEPAAG
ncbi:MAG TPA: PaaI family thioesterase [Solirubrobacterales bacterium]|nr:PaaI family thioesterase [Solirubrobacterales bacterium]